MDVEYVDIVIFHIKRGGKNIIKTVYEKKETSMTTYKPSIAYPHIKEKADKCRRGVNITSRFTPLYPP